MATACHNQYCHVTPGRVRVRVSNLKNNREAASSLQVLLVSQPGIEHVCANPVTGNVLVTFDRSCLTHLDILQSLADLGHFPMKSAAPTGSAVLEPQLSEIGMKIAKVALKQVLSGTPVAILLELL